MRLGVVAFLLAWLVNLVALRRLGAGLSEAVAAQVQLAESMADYAEEDAAWKVMVLDEFGVEDFEPFVEDDEEGGGLMLLLAAMLGVSPQTVDAKYKRTKIGSMSRCVCGGVVAELSDN